MTKVYLDTTYQFYRHMAQGRRHLKAGGSFAFKCCERSALILEWVINNNKKGHVVKNYLCESPHDANNFFEFEEESDAVACVLLFGDGKIDLNRRMESYYAAKKKVKQNE